MVETGTLDVSSASQFVQHAQRACQVGHVAEAGWPSTPEIQQIFTNRMTVGIAWLMQGPWYGWIVCYCLSEICVDMLPRLSIQPSLNRTYVQRCNTRYNSAPFLLHTSCLICIVRNCHRARTATRVPGG